MAHRAESLIGMTVHALVDRADRWKSRAAGSGGVMSRERPPPLEAGRSLPVQALVPLGDAPNCRLIAGCAGHEPEPVRMLRNIQ